MLGFLATLLEIFRLPRVVRELKTNHVGKITLRYLFKDKHPYEIHVYCLERVYSCEYKGLLRYRRNMHTYEVYSVVSGVSPDPVIVRLFNTKLIFPRITFVHSRRKLKARAAIDAYISIILDREHQRLKEAAIRQAYDHE